MNQSNGRQMRSVGQSSGGLFQPDLLLADQLTAVRGMAASEGERQLMVAVLEDAAHCYQKYIFSDDKRGRVLFEEAEEWIMEEDTGAAFPFPQVCEVLGIDPEYIRQGLRRWQAQQMLKARLQSQERELIQDGEMLSDQWTPHLVEPLKKASGE